MALKLADRIKQFTTSSGTGDITFTGTPTGFRAFSSVLTNGDTTYYCIEENDKFEVGIGTYGSDNMVRTTVLASSNSNNHVNLGGSGVVFITYPADKSFYKDLQDQIVVGPSGFLFNNGTTFKDANIIELTDVDSSGTVTSSHLLAFNNTNKSLLLGNSTGASLENNTLIGYGAASGITTATNTVSLGTDAGASNTTGGYNVSVGSFAGPYEFTYADSVSNAVSVGYQAGSRMRSDSTAIGYKAGNEAYEFGFVAIGSNAGYKIGSYGVAVGKDAGYSVTDDYLVAVGYESAKNATGESSTWVGHSAGIHVTGASHSVGLGYQAGKSSSANDSIYIGKSAGQSNSDNDYLYIGNGPPSSSRTLIKGDMQSKRLAIGAADITLADTLHVGVASSTDKGLVVKGAASQSADLVDFQTNAGASVASLTHSGVLTVNSVFASGQGIRLEDNTPVTTAGTIYNAAGKLYFAGNEISPPTGVSNKVAFFGDGEIVYDNDFSFNETNTVLTVANVDIRENFISVGGDASGSGVFGNIELHQDIINFKNQTGLIRIGDYTSLDTGVSDSIGAVMIGGVAGLNASGASNSVFIGRFCASSSTELSNTISIGSSAGISATGSYNVFVGNAAGNQSSGIYNTFVGPNAGLKLVGNRNVEILASGLATTSILNGYDNKLHVQELITGDVPSKKVAIGNVGSTTLSPDATLEVLPKTNTDIGVIVQGAASHTANLQEWQTNNAVAVAHVAIDGSIATSGTIAASGGVLLDNIVPAVTTNKLYNEGGALKFNGSVVGASVDTYTSGVAAYASGQAIENEGLATYASGQAIANEDDIVASSGIANYASGLAITNELNVAYASGQAITNEDDIIATSGIANYASGLAITNELNVGYASGQAIENEGLATYASGQAIDNETDLVYVSGAAAYASGQAIENEGLVTYASGNTANISFGSNAEGDMLFHNGTTFVRLAKGADDYILKMNGNQPNWEEDTGGGGDVTTAQLNYVSGIAVYSSGQAVQNETDIAYTSGIATYASGNTIVNDGLIAYASGNTANITFGSNAEGDILYHDGTSFIRLAKGTDNYILKMNGNVPNWEAESGGDVSATDFNYVSGVANYASGQAIENESLVTYASGQAIANETDLVYVSGAAAYSSGVVTGGIPNFNVVGVNTTTPEYGIDVTGGGGSGIIQATGVKLGASGIVFSDGTTQTVAGAPATVDLTAGDGLTGGGTIASDRTFAVGAGSLIDVQADQVDVDLTEAAAATIAHGDNLIFLDGGATGAASKGSTDDLANLLAGDGLTKSNSVMAVNVDDSTIETNSDAIRVKDNGITLAKMAGLARGKIIYGDTNGDPAALALGSANQVLTSDGTDIAWADNVNTYLSGVAAYASGQAIENEGLVTYASGNTANIAFGSNAEGDILYHNGTSFVRLGKGSDDHILKMNGNVPNWEAESGGGGSPGGSDTQVQFNNSGSFGGDADLTWNSTTNVLTINGTLAASLKAFVIDHPTKDNMKLQYACLEGPENGVYVRGITDSNVIELPDYWIGLVDEDSITVQLTAKGYSQPSLFVDKIKNNKVYLISEERISAYYIVHATRKDVKPLEVECPK